MGGQSSFTPTKLGEAQKTFSLAEFGGGGHKKVLRTLEVLAML